ncbi:Ribosomal protein L11 methyltransferase [Glycine soja]
MAAWNFLKQLTCTVGAHSPTLSRRLIHYSLLVPSLSAHHKIVRYQWLPHFRVNLYAAVPNAKFSTASSSQTLSDTSLAPRAPYTSVLIHCPKDTADVLAEALLCFGASSVSMDQDDVSQSTDEICISSIFHEVEDINVSISHAADSIGLKEIPRYEVKIGDEEDWMKRSQESLHPVQVTEGLWVVPKWCTPPDVQATNIIVNPGLAFGTGEHATTKLCLLLLHGCIKGGEHILDYGTGTGILAIAALKHRDVLTEQIQEIAPRYMLFADDIVLLGESREELNERLETWRRALETHGFRLSRSKSEYMECKFNKRRRVSNSEVKIGDHIIPQVTRFKYLGSVIQDDGEIDGDVNHRIQAGWMKWRKAWGVLCDAKVPIKLKGKFYRTAVRPAILYGTECWAVKSQHENKVGVAEMRMLRWMCGKTRQDKIRNEAIRERVGVAPIVEKMVENRLRWFGHVERRPVDSVVRRVDQMERRQTIRGRGRPKKTIREVIKKDLEINGLDRSMVLDRTLWRKLIHVADPT